MKRILQIYRSVLDLIGKIELVVGIFLLSTIVGCIFAQVFSRYTLGRPLKWVEELSTYFFIWATFVGAAYALKQARHIRILTLLDFFPRIIKEFLAFFTLGCIIFFLVIILAYGIRQMRLEAAQWTIALPIRLSRKYFYSTPLLLACGSMLITSMYLILNQIDQLIRKK
jgi:TRAP-type C4-dicarboxylate transport system permease small subunit